MASSPLSYRSARRFPIEESRKNPILAPPPPVQSQANAADEEDTPSMRELVRAIDAHVDLEATSNFNTIEDVQV